jgi:hypothetical protein
MQSPEHLDEGVINAWLDGQLPPDEAAAVEAHARACEACTALVAEARGYLAGATSILTALDAAPVAAHSPGAGDVVPLAPRAARAPTRPRRVWVMPTAAAATLVVAIGATLTMRSIDRAPMAEPMASRADTAVPARAAPSEESAVPRTPAPAPAPVPLARRVASQNAPPAADAAAASPPVVVPSTRNEAAERRDLTTAKASVAAEQTTVAAAAPAPPSPAAGADFAGRGVAGGVARGRAPESIARAPLDSVPATVMRRGAASAAQLERRAAVSDAAPSAQSAVGVAEWLGCWQVGDPPAGYPARIRLDSTQLATARPRAEPAYRVLSVESSGARAIGWWQPAGAAASGRVTLLPPSLGSAGDAVTVRRIECPR